MSGSSGASRDPCTIEVEEYTAMVVSVMREEGCVLGINTPNCLDARSRGHPWGRS